MTFFSPRTLCLAAAAGMAATAFLSPGASASPLLTGAVNAGADTAAPASNLILAGHKRANRRAHRRAHRRAQRRAHRRAHRYGGPRYRYRRPGYRHYYDGYWYPHAWWLGSLAITAAIASQNRTARRGDAHVNWCLNRYRSYNPRTDMFLAYSGRYKPCISPYSY